MRLDRAWIAAGLLAAAAGFGGYRMASTSKVEPGAPGRTRAEPAPPGPAPGAGTRARADGQAEAVRRLEERLRALEESRAMATAEPVAPPAPAERRRDPEEAADAAAKTLDAALGEERVDPAWSAAMREKIDGFFRSSEAQGSSLRRAECGSTLCRVELSSESRAARERVENNVEAMLPRRSQGFVHVEGDDDLEIVVYFTREGEKLPPLAL